MFEILPQIIWNGIVSGSLLALVALGVSLIYGIGGYIQFAHGEFVAIGAYSFHVLHAQVGTNVFISVIGALLLTVSVSLFCEYVFFRPLRNKGAMIPLIVSVGLSIGIQSILLLFFGSGVRPMSDTVYQAFTLGPIQTTSIQLFAVLSSIVLFLIFVLFLYTTKHGMSLRALSSNTNIAQIFGLNPDAGHRWIFGIAGSFAAIAGIYLGFEQNLTPLMGVTISIRAFTAVILGSVGSVRGAVAGAYIIALTENLVVGLNIIPGSYTSAIAFFVLVAILLIRPQGLFGHKHSLLRQ